MAILKQTSIFRGGRTATSYTAESTFCSAYINKEVGSLNIKFNIASKGGGITCLWVELGPKDLRELIHELAISRPDTAATLSECTSIAIGRNLAMLDKIREKLTILDKLESVAEFVDEKYYDAPAGSDDKEKEISDSLRLAITTLENLHKA